MTLSRSGNTSFMIEGSGTEPGRDIAIHIPISFPQNGKLPMPGRPTNLD